ncbi:uncharacterized protein Tco025E_01698 [Trypanosoma conorhini]|uniref:Uncharacterized protein n=1 Tax=Trypanosoma conorhini TaxID=83891 RepID=A0A422Q7Z5_9TRYP|nr:uncharacterized protein Tco025E_01698 [Trypanosoma conorhini]RNF26069.1 hypothetical protein Tco025E_01698 [Trypanosoma conorhini]
MQSEESTPPTAAERLRAARRREAAVLYGLSFDRRRRGFVQGPPPPRSAPDAACTLGRGGQVYEGDVPLVQRLIQGEFQEPHDAEARHRRSSSSNNDNNNNNNTGVVAHSNPPGGGAAAESTVTDVSTTPVTYYARPLKILSAKWSGGDTPRRPGWCTHSAAAHTRTAKPAVSSSSNAATRTAPPRLRLSSAATAGSSIGGSKVLSRATGQPTTTTRDRPHSSSSSVMTRNTTISTTATVTTMAPRARTANGSKTAVGGPQLQGTAPARPSKAKVHPGDGALVLSKEEYQRLRQLVASV